MWYSVQDELPINLLTYNFLPSWWRGNYGLGFGEKYVFDPDFRVEQYRFMERTICERLPGLHIGSPHPEPQVVLPDFGNAITAIAAGCEVVYPQDNYPWNRHISMEQARLLQVPPDLRQIFPYSEVTRQVTYLNQKLGKDIPVNWNQRGVLNDATLIGGPAFMAEFAENTADSRHLLEYSFGMLNAVITANGEWFHVKEMVMLANCTIMMVSPATYARRLIPYDLAISDLVADQGRKLAVHHCGDFGKYAHVYRQIPEIHWLEIGWGSDLRLALDLFPEAYVQYVISAVFISTATRQEVKELIESILEKSRGDWSRLRLSMPDVEYGTPDENLVEIYETLKAAGPRR